MDTVLSLVAVVCLIWSLVGLIWPKALFFALPSKKKRLHAFFLPLVCMLAAVGIAVALQQNQKGNWVLAGIFCFLAFFYAGKVRQEKKITSQPPGSRASTPAAAPTQSDSGIYVNVSTSYGYGGESPSRPEGSQAVWHGPGKSVEVKGLTLPGMVYVGGNLPDQNNYYNDACLINPKLKISPAEPWQGSDEMTYWPAYDRISPRCRGAYLKWLATGRSEPEAYIGYVFLFFYGLERRLFLDGQKKGVPDEERAAIVTEVRRLLAVYGENHSFRGYASNFLAMEWMLYQRHNDIPEYLNFADRYCAGPFQVLLAQHVAAQKPLPPDVALQWLSLHPEFGLRTPARRCPKEFKTLFAQRYTSKFGDGMLVPPNKKTLSLSYHAASSSLRGMLLNLPNLPDPFLLTAPLKKIAIVAEECTTDLEAYSRYLGRKGSDPASLAALALLPKELVPHASAAGKIREFLFGVTAKGPGLVAVKSLYEALGETPPDQFNKKEAESLATLLEKLGFGLAPDIRYYGIKPELDSSVTVFSKGHGIDFRPSEEFRLIGVMIRLGAMVSQSDGTVSSQEETVLKSLIQNSRELTGIEKDSLLAYLHWSLYTPQGMTGLKQKLAEIGSQAKAVISRILVAVAYADGYLDPKEVKQLEKLYTVLGLDKAQVTGDLHAAVSADVPPTVAVRDAEPTYAVPQPAAASAPAFTLNQELIRIREQETQQVRNVLENIFVEQLEEPAVTESSMAEAPSANPLAELDQAHQSLFSRLLTQENWERSALYELCKELGLMIDGALEVLNEWAFANANAPLIEDGDPVYVDVELAKEITDAR